MHNKTYHNCYIKHVSVSELNSFKKGKRNKRPSSL